MLYTRCQPGKEWEFNIYLLHVIIIPKIANRCRTAVCRTCLQRRAGAVAARASVRERETERERLRNKSVREKFTSEPFVLKSFTLLGTLWESMHPWRACVRVCACAWCLWWPTYKQHYILTCDSTEGEEGSPGGRVDKRTTSPVYITLTSGHCFVVRKGIKFYHDDLACVCVDREDTLSACFSVHSSHTFDKS